MVLLIIIIIILLNFYSLLVVQYFICLDNLKSITEIAM